MPRKLVPTQPDHPYHITARCHNKEWFKIPMPKLWEIMTDYLWYLAVVHEVEIYSFVLMSNHFHLIARFPRMNLAESMRYFMRETSRAINKESGHINQVYGGRYHKSILESPLYYLHAYKYVYRNPVEARVSPNAGGYPFSTLSGKLGCTQLNIPVQEDQTLFNNVADTLDWIQTDPGDFRRELIRSALGKAKFKLRKSQTGREHDLEIRRY